MIPVIDDLERDRAPLAAQVFQRYRNALDTMLRSEGMEHRASVHFLVNMLEAYYFADAQAINGVLGTKLKDYDGDVETIPHPKNDLKKLAHGFDAKKHGGTILAALNVIHVLSNPSTCRSLRTLFGWCSKAIGQPFTDIYQLKEGEYSPVTRSQIDALPDSPSV
jgi:hypothetical protein